MGIDDELTCELCGLPIVDDSYHDGHDGELYHEDCCPSCNGEDWKQQRDELLAACEMFMASFVEPRSGIPTGHPETFELSYGWHSMKWIEDVVPLKETMRAAIAKAKGQTEL